MKKAGILNRDVSALIAGMGHGQGLMIVDAGFPVPTDVRRIDLSLICGIPTFLDPLVAVLQELKLESIIIAHEMLKNNPNLYKKFKNVIGTIPVVSVPHDELKNRSNHSSGIIRTGECSPFANIVLISGVTF